MTYPQQQYGYPIQQPGYTPAPAAAPAGYPAQQRGYPPAPAPAAPAPAGSGDFGYVDDFFGGSAKSLSFDRDKGYQIGQWRGGRIVEIKPKQQQTDMQTRKPQTWDDGSPKWTLPVVVQTDERDPADPHDDGKRTVFIDGGKERALRDHLRSTGAKLRPGGTLVLAWTGGAGKIGDPKQYQAHYTPAEHAAADQMFTGQPPAAPQAQQWGAPAPAAPAAPAMPQQWQQQAPPAAAQQWQAQPPAPAAAAPPVAAPATPTAPAQPAQQPMPGFDAAAIDAAYAHLSEDQRAAIKASGMSPEQVIGVYGPPQQAA